MGLLVVGCGAEKPQGGGHKDKESADTSVEERPVLAVSARLEVVPAPLARRLVVESSHAVQVEVTLDGDEESIRRHDEEGVVLSVPVLGLSPGMSHTVSVRLLPVDGLLEEALVLLDVVVDPLPEPWPLMEVHVAQVERMEPGVTLLPLVTSGTNYLMVIDHNGAPLWFVDTASKVTDVRRWGEWFVGLRDGEVVHWNLMGEVDETHSTGLHHEWNPRPDGGGVALTAFPLKVDSYPVDGADPFGDMAPGTLDIDEVVDLGPSGEELGRWSLRELLDPARVGFDSTRVTREGWLDWSHANAVFEDSDGGLVVSVRHQDCVFKFHRSGELAWILGTHAGWSTAFLPFLLEPTDATMRWPFHQHAPSRLPDGGLLLFDNGNRRTTPYDGEPSWPVEDLRTRVVVFDVDPVEKTVSERWSFEETSSGVPFAPAVGDADFLPETGHILATYGYVDGYDGVSHADVGLVSPSARLVEFAVGPTHELIWDLSIFGSRAQGSPDGWQSYRAERLPSLVP
jgi:arylsulfate sulfotransferase